MREAIDEVTAAVESLVSMSSGYDRGQCISWGEVEAICGPRYEGRSRYVIMKWRKRLEKEREIITLCADGVGVRLLTHQETATEIPELRQRKAYRQIRRAIKQTATVNTDRIPLHARKALAAQRANMAEIRRELFRSRKQLETGKATETNPRRKAVV